MSLLFPRELPPLEPRRIKNRKKTKNSMISCTLMLAGVQFPGRGCCVVLSEARMTGSDCG